MKGLYAEMHEDAILQEMVEEIVYTVSFSMLSEGKTVEEIVEVLGSDDENIIIEKYEEAFKSKTLTEDFDFEYHAEDIALIYEGLGSLVVKGLWKAGKGLFGLVPKAVRLGGRVIKPVVDAGKRTVKRILGPRLVKKLKPLKPAAAAAAGTGAAIATGAAVMNALDKDEKPEKKEEKPEVKTTDSLPDKVKDTEKSKETKIDYTKIFPKGIPDYSGVFKSHKPQQPKPDSEKKVERIKSGKSVYARDPLARASYDPRYDRKTRKEAYDVVLDYLLSEGHAETVEEANYVMMQMDAEHIQSIVEMGDPSFKVGHSSADTRAALRQDKIKKLSQQGSTPGERDAATGKLKGPTLPPV